MSTVSDLASVAARVNDLRRRPERRDELVALLGETALIYAGRSAADAERLRGYILASFAEGPPAEGILEYAREQIESGHEPFAVAAAAKVLRNMPGIPGSTASSLVEAIGRLRSRDAYVWHDELTTMRSTPPDRTMLMELAQSLACVMPREGAERRDAVGLLTAMLAENAAAFHPRVRTILEAVLEGANAIPSPAAIAAKAIGQCCCGPAAAPPQADRPPRASTPPLETAMQDQDGATFQFGDFFGGHVSAVAFFYTRCESPEKCSLTIAKLAQLQRLTGSDRSLRHTRLAAITYDPAFDTPERLKAYGRDRGLAFDERTKLLRTTGTIAPLARHFDLGVSFGASTVNMHRIELAVLDRDARIANSVLRLKWEPGDIAQMLAAVS